MVEINMQKQRKVNLMPKKIRVITNFSTNLLVILIRIVTKYAFIREHLPFLAHYNHFNDFPSIANINILSIQNFLDNAQNGVVYVSLGSIKTLPDDKQKAIINAVSQLKRNVLWETDEKLESLPENILCDPALHHIPVLAHTNVVLYVSHGGDAIMVKQALHNGIPMLILPLQNNQVIIAIHSKQYCALLDVGFNKLHTQKHTCTKNKLLSERTAI